MRKSVLAFAAASSVFALTAAGATTGLELNGGLGSSLAVPNSGSINITQTQCVEAWNVSYTLTTDKTKIVGVTAQSTAFVADETYEVPALCATYATWTFSDQLSSPPEGTWTAATQSWTFDFTGNASDPLKQGSPEDLTGADQVLSCELYLGTAP